MRLKKKYFIIYFLFVVTNFSFSQNQIGGKIVNGSGASLSAAEMTHIASDQTFLSDFNGYFKLTQSGVYIIKKAGYHERVIHLKESPYVIIQLDIKASELNEVIIHANHIPKKLKKATKAISIVSKEAIEQSNSTDFAPILNRVPGVFMQSGALNTNRITIRGVGSRNRFGTSKIRAYFNDIPLTNGNGETTIEDFELASISKMEIIKGPASSIYGSGLGGVIHITPQNAYLNTSGFNSEWSTGSFGLTKALINANYGTSKNSYRMVYSDTHSNGYRDNNEYHRQTFTLSSNHFLNKKNVLTVFTSYVDLKAFIPSSIDENTFLNRPRSAALSWKESRGHEDAIRGIMGVSWNHQYRTSLKHITSIFTSYRNAQEPRPFNILKEHTASTGIRSRLVGNFNLYNKEVNWTFGGELFGENHRYKTYENWYPRTPDETGSVQGNILSNFKETRYYYNVFAEIDYALFEKTTLSLGLNLNRTAYTLKDHFPVSGSNPNQSGHYTFKNIASPKIGLSHIITKNISLFSNISHGFSPITLQETLLPNGQINPNLKPESGWSFEMGTRYSGFNNALQLNATIYQLNTRHLLVSKRLENDRFVGVNAGKTQHNGFELDAQAKWLSKKRISLNTFMSYSVNNFIFKTFIDGLNNHSGNDLTGVPSQVFNMGVNFYTDFKVYGSLNYQHVGRIPITDDNSLYSNNYNLTNLKIGYRVNLNKKLNLNVFLGLNNIFDEHYASQILINASRFNGVAPRYYYPGNPVNYYTGIHFRYDF